jgi:hypothetical protein
MTALDLYVARCDVFYMCELKACIVECDFKQLPELLLENTELPFATHRVACDRPTMTVSLDSRYVVTREHDIINVEVINGYVVIADEPRRFMPALLLLAFAIDGSNGVKMIAGRNPFAPEVSARQVLQQEELVFAKGA